MLHKTKMENLQEKLKTVFSLHIVTFIYLFIM